MTVRLRLLIDSFDGKRLNSPNDVVVKSDGSIWFTDPVFGLLGNYEGYVAEVRDRRQRLPDRRRDRQGDHRCEGVLGAETGSASRRTKRFSTSWNRAVCRTARYWPTTSRRPATRSRASASRSMPAPARPTACAAISTAISGAAGAWVQPSSTASWSLRPDGKPIGRIALPERCANLCFGGLKRNRLFMAASQSIYALYVNTQGALGG